MDYGDILNKENLDQLSIMTYLFQLRDHFETKAMSPNLKKSSFFNFSSSKKNSKNEKDKTLKELVKQTKSTSTPIKLNTAMPASDPTVHKNINDFYRNPFDDDEDEEDGLKETVNKDIKKTGLLQINSNGEVFDIEDQRTSDIEAIPTQAPVGSRRLSRRESLNKSSSSSASSLSSSFKVSLSNFYFMF